jgi:FkbM family methyltransferase
MVNLLVRLLNKLRILQWFNLFASAKLQNRKFIIPVLKGLGKENLDISEKWMMDLFDRLLPFKKGVFIDIGVNTGQTLLKLKAKDNQRIYIGFEPNPNCIFYVQELIRSNKFTNITLYPIGLADKTQLVELNFFTTAATDSAASIITDFRKGSTVYRKEIIPCFKFSDINLALPEDIAFVKIDVEGAELEVLEGIKSLLIEYRPFIIIEILPVYNMSNADRLHRQQAIERLLSELGYMVLRILKQGDSEVKSLEIISEIGVHSNLNYCDYVLSPREHIDILK